MNKYSSESECSDEREYADYYRQQTQANAGHRDNNTNNECGSSQISATGELLKCVIEITVTGKYILNESCEKTIAEQHSDVRNKQFIGMPTTADEKWAPKEQDRADRIIRKSIKSEYCLNYEQQKNVSSGSFRFSHEQRSSLYMLTASEGYDGKKRSLFSPIPPDTRMDTYEEHYPVDRKIQNSINSKNYLRYEVQNMSNRNSNITREQARSLHTSNASERGDMKNLFLPITSSITIDRGANHEEEQKYNQYLRSKNTNFHHEQATSVCNISRATGNNFRSHAKEILISSDDITANNSKKNNFDDLDTRGIASESNNSCVPASGLKNEQSTPARSCRSDFKIQSIAGDDKFKSTDRSNYTRNALSKVDGRSRFAGIMTKTNKNKGKFFCPKCPAALSSKTYLNSHILLHGGRGPYKCHLCDYAVNMFPNLVKHQKNHHRLIVT